MPAYGTTPMQQPPATPGYAPYGYGAPGYGMPGSGMPGYGTPGYGGVNRPYGGGPNFRGPWDRGRGGRSSPWGGNMPWDSNRGGRSMPWDSKSMPWDKGGRGGFMDQDSLADAWDDMLNKPSEMGTMPGGWTAPSISVPNPVDVGDQFGTAAEDFPTQMRNVYEDNRRSNSYYDQPSYDQPYYEDRGGPEY